MNRSKRAMDPRGIRPKRNLGSILGPRDGGRRRFAEEMGVSYSTVCRWVSGGSDMGDREIVRASRILKVSVPYLLDLTLLRKPRMDQIDGRSSLRTMGDYDWMRQTISGAFNTFSEVNSMARLGTARTPLGGDETVDVLIAKRLRVGEKSPNIQQAHIEKFTIPLTLVGLLNSDIESWFDQSINEHPTFGDSWDISEDVMPTGAPLESALGRLALRTLEEARQSDMDALISVRGDYRDPSGIIMAAASLVCEQEDGRRGAALEVISGGLERIMKL